VKSPSNTIVVAGDCHPQTIEVMRTRAAPLGSTWCWRTRPKLGRADRGGDYFAVLAQYPPPAARSTTCAPTPRASTPQQAAFIVGADLLALTLLVPPGELGADIVVRHTQRFGVPMGGGGPHAAYLACRDEFKRSLPGRLVGVSIDAHGAAGLPAGAADARAAHPPREGHQQHLHRAGAAGGDGQHVRRLPRARRA
jgi:glycine dehydrogenase